MDVSKSLGVSPQVVSQLLNGTKPGTKHMPTFSKMLNCSVEWLLNGTGETPTWAVTNNAETIEVTDAIILQRLSAIDAALAAQRAQLDALLANLAARPCLVSQPPIPDPPLRLVPPSSIKTKVPLHK